ncbi:MAG TPA: HAMP domain-containing sensor histidine kinase [Cyclobacteriaceae bacterium]|nr:HAMP domain-containing sensor histidine kinase [Cyclobacteriaceae bacterium]
MPLTEDFSEQKRIKLFERFTLIGALIGVFHFFPDLFIGTKEAPIFDLIISVVSFGAYTIHRKGFHIAGRVLALIFLNLIVTVYACVMPKEIGIYLFYLPMMALSMAVFGNNHRILRLSFTAFSSILLISLFLSDFNLIGPIQFESANEETFFMINLISCAITLVICVNFILVVNQESEKRLCVLAEEVKAKNTELEKTNSELDRFLYSTSHDLRSPLLSIKGLVNITRSESVNPVVQKYLTLIEERADRLDFFIRDIIDYSRNSRTGLSYDLVNLHHAVIEVQQNFQFLEGAANIDFQNDIIVEEVVLDRNRIMIILNNLISNAIKYHRQDGENKWVKTSVSKSKSIITIVVSDNGQGIQADRKDKVFEMFYRGTERSQGSGLGLYIVREAVEKMYGKIHVESIEGAGTSFFITIPVIEVDTAKAIEQARQQQKEQESNLVVEGV